MSLSLYVYRLDFDGYLSAQRSGDAALAARVLAEHAELVAEHDAEYRTRFAAPYLTLSDAVRQIILGGVDPAARPLFQYEHAAVLIAATLGDPLDAGPLNESHASLWGEADALLLRLLARAGLGSDALTPPSHLLSRGPALDVPLDPVNPLGTGYLTPEEVRNGRAVFSQLGVTDQSETEEDEGDEEVLEAILAYSGWLAGAEAAGRGLFFHA